MRAFRALLATLVAVLLGGSLLSVAPAGATATGDDRPVRTIDWSTTQKDYRTFKLKATVEALPNGKAIIEKKSCRKCNWKKAKKVKTNARGVLKTKIFSPPSKGAWFWRVRVNAQDGYARSMTNKIRVVI